MQRSRKINLFPVQTWFPFDLTEIIAIEYLPTGQLHSLRNEQPGDKILAQYSDWRQGRPIQMHGNIYHQFQSSSVLFSSFKPTLP